MDNPLQALTEYVARIEAENTALAGRLAAQEKVIGAVRELCEALEIYQQLTETVASPPAAPARKTRPGRQGMRAVRHTPDEAAAWRTEFLAGATPREIAVKHGTRPSTVSSYLTRTGVKRKDRYPTAPPDSTPPGPREPSRGGPPSLRCGGDVNAGDPPGRDGWCAACLQRELNGGRIAQPL